MADPIRIDELPSTVSPVRDFVIPAMAGGLSFKLSIAQILGLIAFEDITIGDLPLGVTLNADNLSGLASKADAATNLQVIRYAAQTLNAAQKLQGATNLEVLQYASGQVLTAPQKAQAALNMDAIQFASQALTLAQQAQARSNIGISSAGFLYGLNSVPDAGDVSNDISIQAGIAASEDVNADLMVLTTARVKQLDAAWAVGTNQGGRIGALADGTWHAFLIKRSDTGVVDVAFAQSLAPTLPSPYDRRRRIFSFTRFGGVNTYYLQWGNYFLYTSAGITDRNSTAAAANVLQTLTVPTGLRLLPLLRSRLVVGASSNVTISLGHGDETTATKLWQQLFGQASSDIDQVNAPAGMVWTNTSGQVRLNCTINSGTLTNHSIYTDGYIDDRGRTGAI